MKNTPLCPCKRWNEPHHYTSFCIKEVVQALPICKAPHKWCNHPGHNHCVNCDTLRYDIMIEVKQGQIYVNNISLAIKADNFIVIHADLRAKYATFMVGHDANSAIIRLYADENTLYKEDTDAWTEIRLEGYGAGDTGDRNNYWYWPIVEIGRYTMRAAIYKHPKSSEYLWTDK